MRTVLSFPGGGIRGIIPAVYLAELERMLGRPIYQAVDLIVGTSTGGILAIALGAGIPAQQVLEMYVRDGEKIFHRPWTHRLKTLSGIQGSRYPAKGLRDALERVLGDREMGDLLTRVVVTTHRLPSGSYVDGGVHAVDPADCALAQALRLWPGEPILLISIGNKPIEEDSRAVFIKTWSKDNGRSLRCVDAAYATSAAPTYFPPLVLEGTSPEAAWGLLDWGKAFPEMALDGSSGVVEYRTQEAIGLLQHLRPGSEYFDIRPLRLAGSLDNARPAHIRELRDIGLEMTHANRRTTEHLIAILRAHALEGDDSPENES